MHSGSCSFHQVVNKSVKSYFEVLYQDCLEHYNIFFTSGYAKFSSRVYFKQRRYFWKAGKIGDQHIHRYHKQERILRGVGGCPPYIPDLTYTCVPLLLRLLPSTCRASLPQPLSHWWGWMLYYLVCCSVDCYELFIHLWCICFSSSSICHVWCAFDFSVL